jgi:hypothetical protein
MLMHVDPHPAAILYIVDLFYAEYPGMSFLDRVPTRLRSPMVALAGTLLIALALSLSLPDTPLNLYDVSFALLWGRDLIEGRIPDVHLFGASTPHPASILVGALAALFGAGALSAMRMIVYIAAGALVVAFVALGRARRLSALGPIAALTLAASAPIVFTIIGQATASDLPAAAAVLGALALEAATPRRGSAPLVLLALAGLFRPEAWVLSAAYWCYLAPSASTRDRIRFAALAASGPLLWAADDLLLTGNPLYSLTYTQRATLDTARPTGLAQAPQRLLAVLTQNLGVPVLVGATCGILINLRTRHLPVVLAPALALSAASFVALGAATLPLDQRYALPVLCLSAIFFAYFLVGWSRVSARGPKCIWALAALVVAALSLAEVPANLRDIDLDRDGLSRQAAAEAALAQLVAPPAVRSVLAGCSPLDTDWRIVPILAFDLHRNPTTLTVLDSGVPNHGVVIEATRGVAGNFFQDITHPVASFERRHFRVIAHNDDFTMYARC